MRTLTNHIEKIVAFVLVVVCALSIVHAVVPRENQTQADLKAARNAIEEALNENEAGGAFPYLPEKQTDYADRLTGCLDVGAPVSFENSAAFSFYPQPARPEVVQESPDAGTPSKGSRTAALPAPEHLRAEAQQGLVRVSWELPKSFELFAPVRLELYRGTSESKVDQKIASISLEAEKQADRSEGNRGPGEEAEASAPQEPLHATRRTMIRRSKTSGKAGAKTKKSTFPTSFDDQDVEEHTTYVYKARIVGKLADVNPDMTILVGTTLCEVTIPKTVEKLTEGDAASAQYGGAWSAAAKAQVLSSIQLRMAGVMGEVPPHPDPAQPASGYSAYLSIRRWSREKRQWGDATVTIPVGKPIVGEARFRLEGGGSEKLKFDLGLVLTAVRHGISVSYQKRMVAVIREVVDPETEEVTRMPVLDDQGRPVMTERVIVIRVPTLVALLTETETGKVFRYPRRKEYGSQMEGEAIFLEDEKPPVIGAEQGAREEGKGELKTAPAGEPGKAEPAKTGPDAVKPDNRESGQEPAASSAKSAAASPNEKGDK